MMSIISIDEAIDAIKKSSVGGINSTPNHSYTPTVSQPQRISIEEMQEEMLKRAAPEYAARYAAESPAVYNAYNKTVGDFAGIYGAEEFATTFNKDFKNVNAQQIANLKTLSTDLDKQQKYLSSAIDSGIYGENTEQARTELAQIEQMKKNVDGAIKFVENDTSVKEYYYSEKV